MCLAFGLLFFGLPFHATFSYVDYIYIIFMPIFRCPDLFLFSYVLHSCLSFSDKDWKNNSKEKEGYIGIAQNEIKDPWDHKRRIFLKAILILSKVNDWTHTSLQRQSEPLWVWITFSPSVVMSRVSVNAQSVRWLGWKRKWLTCSVLDISKAQILEGSR